MRVITGSAKGRKLYPLGKLPIRPTLDKVKSALFSVLGHTVSCHSFLDLCAGSGAVGIEALSRGAREVQFVEINKGAVKLIRKNLSHCGFDPDDRERVQVIQTDAEEVITRFYKQGKVFDTIFMDAPYRAPLPEKILASMSRFPIVSLSGKIIVEHFFKTPPQATFENIGLERRTRYGDTTLSYYAMEAKGRLKAEG